MKLINKPSSVVLKIETFYKIFCTITQNKTIQFHMIEYRSKFGIYHSEDGEPLNSLKLIYLFILCD